MTIGEIKQKIVDMFSSFSDPFLEARVILSHNGISEIDQITKKEALLSDSVASSILEDAKKRASGIPSSYITKEKEFYGEAFFVNPSVLIPRPDTEALVDIALEKIPKEGNILDLCTGSGIIAATVAKNLKRDVFFSDISPQAIEIATLNYERITGRKAKCKTGDLFLAWEGYTFSAILSNPPYLTQEWWEETEREVKEEPLIAFLGYGEDGLDIIRRIIEQAPLYLEKNGILVLECDFRQTKAVKALMEENGFTQCQIIKDLSGKERVVYGEKR